MVSILYITWLNLKVIIFFLILKDNFNVLDRDGPSNLFKFGKKIFSII